MALSDTLNALAGTGKPQITRLLEQVEQNNPEDLDVLKAALVDPNIPPHVLTKALWAEYGRDCVSEGTVAKYRSRKMQTVNGL